jgi:hypothetical protein
MQVSAWDLSVLLCSLQASQTSAIQSRFHGTLGIVIFDFLILIGGVFLAHPWAEQGGDRSRKRLHRPPFASRTPDSQVPVGEIQEK